MPPPEHRTIVKAATHSPGWVVICARCGQLGPPHARRAPALDQAAAHTRVDRPDTTGGGR